MRDGDGGKKRDVLLDFLEDPLDLFFPGYRVSEIFCDVLGTISRSGNSISLSMKIKPLSTIIELAICFPGKQGIDIKNEKKLTCQGKKKITRPSLVAGSSKPIVLGE